MITLQRIIKNSFIKDSTWSVLGNGLGSALLLLAGILIARNIGKDAYGEYGIIKTTMFLVSYIATLGLGYTSTKHISEYSKTKQDQLSSLFSYTITVTFLFSSVIGLILFIFAKNISDYIGIKSLILPFRYLSIIIILRALNTTSTGILSGLKKFKYLAITNIIGGLIMLGICIPLSQKYGLNGAILSLLLSQLFIATILIIRIIQIKSKLRDQKKIKEKKRILYTSIPLALQDTTYAISNWIGTIMLVKLATIGDVAIYSAASQWIVIANYIPTTLSGVMLYHLTSSSNQKHSQLLKKLLLCISSISLFIGIAFFIASPLIASMYGQGFEKVSLILRILTVGTIFGSSSIVLQSELISKDKNWFLFTTRVIRDMTYLILAYFLITRTSLNPVTSYAASAVIIAIVYFIALIIKTNLTINRR